MKSIVTGVAIGLAAVGLATSVPAQSRLTSVTATGEPFVVVSFADLNVDSDRGRAVLDRRLRFAARRVCGEPTRILSAEADRRECLGTTLDGAWSAFARARGTQFASHPRTITLASVGAAP